MPPRPARAPLGDRSSPPWFSELLGGGVRAEAHGPVRDDVVAGRKHAVPDVEGSRS